jgi:chromosome partitioning protein
MLRVSGQQLKQYREARGLDQKLFLDWLRTEVGRKYDQSRLSRWENDAETVPWRLSTFFQNLPDWAPNAEREGKMSVASEPVEQPPAPAGDRAGIIVAVANQKGGVGKTTTSVNLTAAMAAAGWKVLLIDADSQANATMHVGHDWRRLEKEKATLYYSLRADRPLSDITIRTGDFDLVPSGIKLSEADLELITETGGQTILKGVIEDVRSNYDIIIIDCPPNLGMLTVNSLAAADWVLIPVQTEFFAQMGLTSLFETIKKVRQRLNKKLKMLGAIPTMYNPRLRQDKSALAELTSGLEDILRVFPPIERSTHFAQSQAEGKSTVSFKPNTSGVKEYIALANLLAEEVLDGR